MNCLLDAALNLLHVGPVLVAAVHVAVELRQLLVVALQLLKQVLLRGPHVQLVLELRDDEEGSPAAQLLGLEDVAKDVVADVQDVPALGA